MMRGFCPRGFCPEGAYVLMELCMEGVLSEGVLSEGVLSYFLFIIIYMCLYITSLFTAIHPWLCE